MIHYSKIEIKTKGESPSVFTEMFIDGKQIHGVRSVRYENSATSGNVPTITIDLNALDVSIDSEVFKLRQKGHGIIKKIEFEEE